MHLLGQRIKMSEQNAVVAQNDGDGWYVKIGVIFVDLGV